MKPKEFREMVEKTMPKSDASKMEKHVFRIYDSNNDGYIDFVEFMLIFHIMSDGTPEEVLEKIFRVFDVNSDGTINKKEMQRLIKDMYGLIKADDPEAESKDLMAKSAFCGDGQGRRWQDHLLRVHYRLPFPGEDQQDARPEGHRHLRRRGLKRDKLFFSSYIYFFISGILYLYHQAFCGASNIKNQLMWS